VAAYRGCTSYVLVLGVEFDAGAATASVLLRSDESDGCEQLQVGIVWAAVQRDLGVHHVAVRLE